jgi:NAD(P)-dependent dehydrogenase (short-subunit alcohol dehydrogenase family)
VPATPSAASASRCRTRRHFVELDVADDASVATAVAELARQIGQLDVLINNAGIVGPHKAFADLTGTDAQQFFNTNVFSIVRMTNAFLSLCWRNPPRRSSSMCPAVWAPSLPYTTRRGWSSPFPERWTTHPNPR